LLWTHKTPTRTTIFWEMHSRSYWNRKQTGTQLSEIIESLGIIGVQLRAPLQLLNTVVFWWLRGFRGSINWVPRTPRDPPCLCSFPVRNLMQPVGLQNFPVQFGTKNRLRFFFFSTKRNFFYFFNSRKNCKHQIAFQFTRNGNTFHCG